MSKRKIWNTKEDEVLRHLGEQSQQKNWSQIAKRMSREFGLKRRTGKQCRQRWYNQLDPDISKKAWSKAEEQHLLSLHKIYGNKWTLIAEEMAGRTDNSIKNYFYSTVRRNLRRMGKYCGSKNSTGIMRQIKPSTMTRIFGSLNEYGNEGIYRCLQTEGLTKDFLKQSCQNIRDEIIKFSSFKPKKKDKISEEEKRKYDEVFWLIRKVNQIYQKIKSQEKSNQTQKQLFRNYYQQMNKQSSEEAVQQDSDFEEDVPESSQEEIVIQKELNLHANQLRTSKKVQVISLCKPSSPQFMAQSLSMMRSSGENAQQKPTESKDDSTHNRVVLESTLSNIVEYAQQIEFNDPEFNIEMGEQREKASESNNLEIHMSNMSFKSASFGSPTSQVNFFKSPKNTRNSCLHDYLMRMSNSFKEQLCLGLSEDAKEVEKEAIAKRQG